MQRPNPRPGLAWPPSETRADRIASLALLVLLAAAPSLVAQESGNGQAGEETTAAAQHDSAPSGLLGSGSGSIWSVYYGYGFNHVINNSAEGIDLASTGLRWTHLWSQKGGGFLRGHPGFAVEVMPLTIFIGSASTSYGAGFNFLYEHHFAARGRVLPIWRIGTGFLYANTETPRGETNHNFSLLTALGVDIAIAPTGALLLEYRFHHISNAESGLVNPGINAHTIVFGVSFYR